MKPKVMSIHESWILHSMAGRRPRFSQAQYSPLNKALWLVFAMALMPRDCPAQTVEEIHTEVIPKILLRPADVRH